METRQFQILKKELEAVKNLLALQLKQYGTSVTAIGKAMGVTPGRLSQILGESKGESKRKKKK